MRESDAKHGFTFRHFLRDRSLFLVSFSISFALVLLVIFLDMLRHRYYTGWDSLLYMLILALAGLLTGLFWDYFRQKAFYRSVNSVLSDPKPDLETITRIQRGITHEQQVLLQILQDQHMDFMSKLTQYRKQQDFHHDFTNQWVHQMKTPVSVIDLLIQQSKELQPAPPLQELLQSIREENERITYGLEMMLHTARLDKFELDLHVKQLDLLQLVRRVVNRYKKACIRWSIYPKVTGDEQTVATDEKWLGFVLNQLVTNALKYSRDKPGNKQLLIVVEQTVQGCRLRVTDEGIGIAEQDQPRVFDPFFTGDNGRLYPESTGMGLYLAKQICSRLGHRLELQSVPGEGTTATIHFTADSLHRMPFLEDK
ncbi:sensor histidine kinase [Brevibacillus sp. B_LB10_24]|uniref:sensor histidine kinase n=1 Tax=Brevibacillus sp. B_LB10_24 TaxID=3380645 RepID=UPI0038BC88AE